MNSLLWWSLLRENTLLHSCNVGKIFWCQSKQWSCESMEAAVKSVKEEGMRLREASCLYNVPIETLWRVIGNVELGCRSGPLTILTDLEETKLAEYVVQMDDMGFGLSREDLQIIAFQLVDKSGTMYIVHLTLFIMVWQGQQAWVIFCMALQTCVLHTTQPLSYRSHLFSRKGENHTISFVSLLQGLYCCLSQYILAKEWPKAWKRGHILVVQV